MKDLILPNTCINFHVIDDQDWFEMVVKLLKQMYTMASLEDLYSYYYEGVSLKNTCHITFDDGDRTVYEKAFPILKKHNVPASIYVSPKAIVEQENFWFQEIRGYDENILKNVISELNLFEKDISNTSLKPLLKELNVDMIWEIIHRYRKRTNTALKPCMNMNVEQLLELDQSGLVAIGAHTLDHPILKNESDIRAANEISESVEWLGDLLDKPIKHFAYPNGRYGEDFGEREKDLLQKERVKLAFSTEYNNFSRNDDLLSIPRKGITKGGKIFIFLKLISGKNWMRLKHFLLHKD